MNKNQVIGTIKSLKYQDGYGFLVVDSERSGVFFHANDLVEVKLDALEKGDKVIVEEIEHTDRGAHAIGVRLLADNNSKTHGEISPEERDGETV